MDHSWTYRNVTERPPNGFTQTVDEISIERVTPTAIYVNAKPSGSSQTPRQVLSGLDWSRIRDVNGKETRSAWAPISNPSLAE